MSTQLVQDIVTAVHRASALDVNASTVASNFQNIETVLNLTGFVKNALNGVPNNTEHFDMDSEIALLHSEDSEFARQGVSTPLKERLPTPQERIMWEKYNSGKIPQQMVDAATNKGRTFVRTSSMYRADVATRSALARDLLTQLSGVKHTVSALNRAATLWEELSHTEQQLTKAREDEEQDALTSTSLDAKGLASHLKRLESTTLDLDSEQQPKYSAAVRIKNGIVVEFDNVQAYVSSSLNEQLVLHTVKKMVANQFGWSLSSSWITTSNSLSAEEGVLSASIRFDAPTMSAAKRIAASLQKFATAGRTMSSNVVLTGALDHAKTTKMTVRWSEDFSQHIEVGTVAAQLSKPQSLTVLEAPMSAATDSAADGTHTGNSTANTTSTAAGTPTPGIQEKANDDWYLDLNNNNGASPSKDSILLATVWEGPSMAATFFDTIVAPIASAERAADQAHKEQQLAQQQLIASELELKTLNIREKAIHHLLEAVDKLSMEGQSEIVDKNVLRTASILTLHNQHGPASVEHARATIATIVQNSLQNVHQTTLDAKKAEQKLAQTVHTRWNTQPMETPINTAHEQNLQDKNNDVKLMDLLATDKLYQELVTATHLLDAIKKASDGPTLLLTEQVDASLDSELSEESEESKHGDTVVDLNFVQLDAVTNQGQRQHRSSFPGLPPILSDIGKRMKETMKTMLVSGERVSTKLLSEAKSIQKFQQKQDQKHHAAAVHTAKSTLSVVRKQLKIAVAHNVKLQKRLDVLHAKHNITIKTYQHNLTAIFQRYHNLTVAVNLTTNATLRAQFLPSTNITAVAAPKKMTNRSQCASPCPCDDLGFSLCECCGASFPTVAENKKQELKTEHLVTTTSEVLRQLKHQSQKLGLQCKSETSAVNDAKQHVRMLTSALVEAKQALQQYQGLVGTNKDVRPELKGYIQASELQVHRVTSSKNSTMKKLNAVIAIARQTCVAWKQAHWKFTHTILAARAAKVGEVRSKLQDKMEGVKKDLQHQKEVRLLTNMVVRNFNTSLLPLLNTITGSIAKEVMEGSVPASVFGLVETAKLVQRNSVNIKALLLGQVTVSLKERNVSVLELLVERSEACSKEVENHLTTLDRAIQMKNMEEDRLQRSNLLRLDRVLQGDHVHSLNSVARNMSAAGRQYRMGVNKHLELEKITELKHLPFKKMPTKSATQSIAVANTTRITATSVVPSNVTHKKSPALKLKMPGIDATSFDQDANIEELDAMVLDEAILGKKRIVTRVDGALNTTNATATAATTARSSHSSNSSNTTAAPPTKIETEAEQILYAAPPLLIGETWANLRKNGQVNTGLLKGAVDNVHTMLSSSKKELDVAVNDYCGALNRHVMLDLESKFVKEQIQHGAHSLAVMHSNQSTLLPVLHSKPLSALHQMVEDILANSQNGTQPLHTEMARNVSQSFYMLVPTAKGLQKEPTHSNDVVNTTNKAKETSESYVAHYYSQIRTLEQQTLQLMVAKENAWQTYTEELLLQHMGLTKDSSPPIPATPTDSVSSAQTQASIATDAMANALAKQMQAQMEPLKASLKAVSQAYTTSVHHASSMEEQVVAAKQKVRHDMTLAVRNKIFTCATNTQRRFTRIVHQRVRLAQYRADEKGKWNPESKHSTV